MQEASTHRCNTNLAILLNDLKEQYCDTIVQDFLLVSFSLSRLCHQRTKWSRLRSFMSSTGICKLIIVIVEILNAAASSPPYNPPDACALRQRSETAA